MNSNRLRLPLTVAKERTSLSERWCSPELSEVIEWEQMPAPLPVPAIDPDEIIQDILEATLLKIKNKSGAEMSAAASRCLLLLRSKRA
jgi:hypothetical protein